MAYSDLNPKQKAILELLQECSKTRGVSPSYREIAETVHLGSTSTVQFNLNALEKKGYIHRDPNRPRSIEVVEELDRNDTVSLRQEVANVPIVGRISAGQPAYAEQNVEDYFPIPINFLNSNKQLYMLRVNGDSMIEVGIENGDLLIVEEADTARNGEIVVALIDDEATVKTFYREINRFRLQPENHLLEPIYTDHVQIIGKPIGLFRRF